MKNWLFGTIVWPIFNIVSTLDYRRHPNTSLSPWLAQIWCNFSLGPMNHSALLQPSITEVQPKLTCTAVQWSAPSFWVHLLAVCFWKMYKKVQLLFLCWKLNYFFFFMVTEQVSPSPDLITVVFLLAYWEEKHCYRNGLPPSVTLRPIAGRIM